MGPEFTYPLIICKFPPIQEKCKLREVLKSYVSSFEITQVLSQGPAPGLIAIREGLAEIEDRVVPGDMGE